MKKQFILLFLVTIFMVTTFVVAQPPFQTTETLPSTLTIIYPKFDYYPFAPVQPHIHVFNSTGYPVLDANCTLHIYNNTGNHVYQGNFTKDDNGIDYYLNLTRPFINLTLYDWYSFTTWCTSDTSNEAGFLSGSFQITQKGEQSVPMNEGLFYLPIAYALLVIALLIIYQNMPQEHIFIKTLIIFLIPALFVGITGFALKLAATYTGASTVLWFFRFSNWFSYIFAFYFAITLFISIKNFYKKKRHKN